MAKKLKKKKVKATKKAAQKTTKKVAKKATKKVAKKSAPKKAAKASPSMVGKHISWTASDSQGQSVSSAAMTGRKVVLYFYPKDDTPGCTIEGQEFDKHYEAFKSRNVEVFGVSRDSIESHDKFKCKFSFRFELLSDPDEKLCRAFDVIKEKNMYGRKVMGIERSTFVLDENGNVLAEYRKVKAEGHAEQVLKNI